MEEEINVNPYKPTYKPIGAYVVVHHGSQGARQKEPCFLRRTPYRLSSGEWQETYKHFTFDLRDAALFYSLTEAEKARDEVVAKLVETNHPLKDSIKVLRLFGLEMQPLEDWLLP